MNNAANITRANGTAFDGSFDLLPFRANLDFGTTPYAPLGDDFHLAVSRLRHAEDQAAESACGTITWAVAAARWQVEAIRARRSQPGCSISTPEIFARVSSALIDWSRGQ